MNRILSVILLLSVIVFGCSSKCPISETKTVEPVLCNCDNKDSKTGDKINTPTKTEATSVNVVSATRSYKCKDRAGRDYVLELLNSEIENKPVTVIGFAFKSASKKSGNASAYWLETKKDGADLKILEDETVIDGDTVISDDFFLGSVVEYYLAVKRFELDDDIWKRISIEHSADLESNHPYHNSKSTCSLIQQ